MKTPRERVTIKISRKLHKKLARIREQTGVPISNIIRLAVALYVRPAARNAVRARRTKLGSR